jgi:hypothetical protein
MDHRIKGALPLAFALAMAADLSATGAMNVPEGESLWRAGSLSQLLGDSDSVLSGISAEDRSAAAKGQMAQWLNFRNCFTGYWRNC